MHSSLNREDRLGLPWQNAGFMLTYTQQPLIPLRFTQPDFLTCVHLPDLLPGMAWLTTLSVWSWMPAILRTK